MRIALLGGSFNPVHNAHLAIAEKARKHFQLDQVTFVPAYRPPHKSGQELVSTRHRLAMVRLAIRPFQAFFSLSDYEIQKKGTSYTIDTVRYFTRKFKVKEPSSLYFIIGEDMLALLPQWAAIQELLSLCTFIWIPRSPPTADLWPPLEKTLGCQTVQCLKKYRLPLRSPLLISSSDIRRNLASKKEPVWDKLPLEVLHYIYKNKLYGTI